MLESSQKWGFIDRILTIMILGSRTQMFGVLTTCRLPRGKLGVLSPSPLVYYVACTCGSVRTDSLQVLHSHFDKFPPAWIGYSTRFTSRIVHDTITLHSANGS